MVGERIGHLTVLRLVDTAEYVGARTTGAVWLCKCDCGTEVMRQGGILRAARHRRNSTSCEGCAHETRVRWLKTRVRTWPTKHIPKGTVFGKLTTTGVFKSKSGWECTCSCGNTTYVPSYNLKSGNTKSCGCGRKDTFSSWLGSKHPLFNPNITNEEREKRFEHRATVDKRWRDIAALCKQRDQFTCAYCRGTSGLTLVSHHLNGWKERPDLRYEPSNVVTLCQKCHLSYHKKFGFVGSTPEKFAEFMKKKTMERSWSRRLRGGRRRR
jgi:5-methylcytosine-specific restriction endonuclease McrA